MILSQQHPISLGFRDIAYIHINAGFAYLSLITDAYSRKIVGFYLSKDLSAQGSLKTLKMARVSNLNRIGLIHHSDRGVQYCCDAYVSLLLDKKNNIRISMTENGDPLENAIAKRVNGILKDEFYLDQCFFDTEKEKLATKSAIKLYNNKRLHLPLGYKTPNEVFVVNIN